MRIFRSGIATAFVVLLFGQVAALRAHPAYFTCAVARIDAGGRFEVWLQFDALAFALNDTSERVSDDAMRELLALPLGALGRVMQDARQRFEHGVTVAVAGSPVTAAEIVFPTAAMVLEAASAGGARRLPIVLDAWARGRLPPHAQAVELRFPELIGRVLLTVERPGEEPVIELVDAGEASRAFAIAPVSNPPIGPPQAAHASIRRKSGISAAGLARMVALGFEHILPRGFDHVLFIVGLFLLNARLSALFWQVTAFTVAHSLTLALSLYGVIRISSSLVEPLIALSIVLVALDNLRSRELRRWRVAVVFGFGLVHGLGFAGALREIGWPKDQFVAALFGFNLGVELGQLAVIALTFLLVGWFRAHALYRRTVVLPASLVIAAMAIVWSVQRMLAV